MKFNCGPSFWDRMIKQGQERHAYLSDWHPYFLWMPKRIREGECRWLETIWRLFGDVANTIMSITVFTTIHGGLGNLK